MPGVWCRTGRHAEKWGFGILDEGREKQPRCFRTHHTAPQAFRTGWEQAEAPCCLEFPKEMLVGKGLSYPLAARFSSTSLLAERRIPDCSLDIRCRAGKQEKIQGFIYSFPFTRCVSPEPKGRYFTLHF